MDNKITLRHCIDNFNYVDSYKVVDIDDFSNPNVFEAYWNIT